MGIECFLARIECSQSGDAEAARSLLIANGGVQDSDGQRDGMSTWKVDTGDAFIECEISRYEAASAVKFRFALCQPDSVVDAYISLLRQAAACLRGSVVLMEDVDSHLYTDIEGTPSLNFERAMKLAIGQKQFEWDKEFGSVRVKATVLEAIRRYLLSR